jgi:hypothetical protein
MLQVKVYAKNTTQTLAATEERTEMMMGAHG